MKDINWNDAPEWADRLMRNKFNKFWCSEKCYVSLDSFKKEDESKYEFGFGRGFDLSSFELIEMRPEQPTKVDEWVPSVGEECEISNCGNPFEVSKILFMGKEVCVVNHPHFKAIEQHYHLSSIEFRPLKTAEEKEREEFIDWAYALTMSTDESLRQVFAVMHAAGFTAPKEEDQEWT